MYILIHFLIANLGFCFKIHTFWLPTLIWTDLASDSTMNLNYLGIQYILNERFKRELQAQLVSFIKFSQGIVSF
jgi:hypothetical protein